MCVALAVQPPRSHMILFAHSSELCRRCGQLPDRSDHPSMARSIDLTTPAIIVAMDVRLTGPCRLLRKQDKTQAHFVIASRSRRHQHWPSQRIPSYTRHEATRQRTNADSPPSDSWDSLSVASAFTESVLERPQVETTMNPHSVADPRERRWLRRPLRPSHLPAV